MEEYNFCLMLFMLTFLLILVLIVCACLRKCLRNDKFSITDLVLHVLIGLLSACEVLGILWVSCKVKIFSFPKPEFNIDVNDKVSEYFKTECKEDLENEGLNDKLIPIKLNDDGQVEIKLIDQNDNFIVPDYDSSIGARSDQKDVAQSTEPVESQDVIPIISYSELQNKYNTAEGYFIFIPFTEKELRKIDISSNGSVISLKCKRDSSYEYYLYITKSCEFMTPQTIVLKMDSDTCKLLESKRELDEMNTPGLGIWIEDKLQIDRIMRKSIISYVKCPEIKDGEVSFNYCGNVVVTNKKTLKLWLLDCAIPRAVNKYELLLNKLLDSYPNDIRLIYPISKSTNIGQLYWVDTYKGRLTVGLLKMFDPFVMLSRRGFNGANKSDLFRKVEYLLNYIKNNNITVDDTVVGEILNFIKDKLSFNYYDDFRYSIPVHSDVRFTLEDLVNKDFRRNYIYKYIFSIAAYPYTGGNGVRRKLAKGETPCMCSNKGCDCDSYDIDCCYANHSIEELLISHGLRDFMYEVIAILSNYYDKPIKCGSNEYSILKVHSFLQKMCDERIIGEEDIKKEYTGKDLINLARLMINNKYNSQAALLHFDSKLFTVKLGSVVNGVVLFNKCPSVINSPVIVDNNIALEH